MGDNNSGVRRRATYVSTSDSRRNTKQDQELNSINNTNNINVENQRSTIVPEKINSNNLNNNASSAINNQHLPNNSHDINTLNTLSHPPQAGTQPSNLTSPDNNNNKNNTNDNNNKKSSVAAASTTATGSVANSGVNNNKQAQLS